MWVRVLLRSRHFLSENLWHFPKSTRSCVENECCCPRTVNISNVNFILKISILPVPVFNTMGQQMYGPDSSTGYNIWHESERWGFETPSGRDIFMSRKLWHFPKNSRLCVEIEWSCPHTVHISNVNFTLYIHTHTYIYIYIYIYILMQNSRRSALSIIPWTVPSLLISPWNINWWIFRRSVFPVQIRPFSMQHYWLLGHNRNPFQPTQSPWLRV